MRAFKVIAIYENKMNNQQKFQHEISMNNDKKKWKIRTRENHHEYRKKNYFLEHDKI